MGNGRREDTALGVARARFIEGLPRKASDLAAPLAALRESPDATRPREELRRRCHALYASAQVFRLASLAASLKEALARLDAARDGGASLAEDDLELLERLMRRLPEAGREAAERSGEPSTGAESRRAVPKPGPSGPGPKRPPTPSVPSEPGPRGPATEGRRPPTPAVPAPAAPSGAPSASEAEASGVGKASVSASASGGSEPSPDPRSGASSRAPVPGASAAPIPAPGAAASKPSPSRRPSSGLDEARRVGARSSFGVGADASPAAAPPKEAPSRRPPSERPAPLDTVLSVLVLADVERRARLQALLSSDRFELLFADDAEEALRVARSSAPDAVIAEPDRALRSRDFVARLRSDPLTDFVPLCVVLPPGRKDDPITLREAGADDVLAEPLDRATLVRSLGRLTGTLPDSEPGGLAGLGEVTVEEVADRVAFEIRRGIVDSAERGHAQPVPLGDGSEILAAAWAAVARVRAEIAHRSGGRVRFRDGPRRGGPALLALSSEEEESELAGRDIDLTGRRIIVADDDPAVVWFFAGLLREEGVDVVEAEHGAEALAAALRRRPDVIISDILMPEMDGFALCRALAREPGLAEVPVILLSWKEDFLQRMRELRSGARGYLRKEAESAQIIGRVRQVLRPRARLEAQLRAGGEVRGRLDPIGTITLLRTVAEAQLDARLAVRDAWHLFELELRGGDPVRVTRTAADGTFAEGAGVMPGLLGLTSGRFTATPSDQPVDASLELSLEEALSDAADRLGAWLDSVSGRGLMTVERVRFDEEVLRAVLATSPPFVRTLVERMRARGPRALVVGGEEDAQTVESVLSDLVRHGALTAVEGPAGADRVREALARRRQRSEPPPGVTDDSDVHELDLPFVEPAALGDDEPLPHAQAGQGPVPSSPPSVPALSAPPRAAPVQGPAARSAGASERSPETEAVESRPVGAGASPAAESGAPPVSPAQERPPAPPSPPAPPAPPGPPSPPERLGAGASTPGSGADSSPLPAADEDARPEALSTLPPAAPRPERRSPLGGLLGFAAIVVALGVAAFFITPLVWPNGPDRASPASSTTGPRELRKPSSGAPAPDEPGSTQPAPASPRAAGRAAKDAGTGDAGAESSQALAARLAWYETRPSLVDPDVSVAEGEGLLIIGEDADGATRVKVGDRDLGPVPVRTALAEGRYEVVFERGAETTYRYLYVPAGQSVIAPVP